MSSLAATVRTLGPAPTAAFELLHAAAAFRSVSAPADDELLTAYDEHTDALITGTAALLCFAPNYSERVVTAVRLATDSGQPYAWEGRPRYEAAIARLVYGIVVTVLHLDGPAGLVPLSSIDVDGAPLLGNDALRFARHHDGDANVAYAAVADWITGRPWITELPGLDDSRALAAIAEADLLLACIAVRRTGRDESYSAGGARETSVAPARLGARLRDPGQRAGLAALLDTNEEELDSAVAAADRAVRSTSHNGLPIRRASIVR